MSGLLDQLRWMFAPPGAPSSTPSGDTGLQGRSSVEDIIRADISQRQQQFTVQDAMRLPSVRRGFDLITSLGSSFAPQAFRDGLAVQDGPRIIDRPDPFRSRQEFISSTLEALLTYGEAFWRLGPRDQNTGHVRWAIVLANPEVTVRWADDTQLLPEYVWREQNLVLNQDIHHLAIRRPAGALHGVSPIQDALPYLATLDAQERMAAVWFGAAGVPYTVLSTDRKLDQEEATKLKRQWAESRAEATLAGEPAVTSGGVSADFPGVSPQQGQLQESRDFANTVVARLLGIPAPLMLANIAGSSLTYQNQAAVTASFTKQTLLPMYLAPLEASLTDMTSRSTVVRFSLQELARADVGERMSVYGQLVDMGALSAEEVRLAEGWGAPPHDITPANPEDPAEPARALPGVPAK